MTYDEIVDEARARIRDAGRNLPNRLLLRQVGLHQAHLFMRCAVWNPEYYGICVTAPLSPDKGLDLNGLTPPLNQAAGIQRIEVHASSGTGAPEVGTRISIVPLEDPRSGIPPRMTLRDNALRQVGTDLDLVTEVEIYYARLSNPVTPTDGGVQAEMRDPWVQLLVLDCATYIGQLLAAEGRAVPQGILEMITGEYKDLVVAYEAHVRGYVTDVEDRFRRTGGAA